MDDTEAEKLAERAVHLHVECVYAEDAPLRLYAPDWPCPALELVSLQRDYSALWSPLSDLLKQLSALVDL